MAGRHSIAPFEGGAEGGRQTESGDTDRINWQYRRNRADHHTIVPYYFFGSEADVDLLHWHGDDPTSSIREQHRGLREIRTVPGGGHMIAMENPTQVNDAFIDFLAELDRS